MGDRLRPHHSRSGLVRSGLGRRVVQASPKLLKPFLFVMPALVLLALVPGILINVADNQIWKAWLLNDPGDLIAIAAVSVHIVTHALRHHRTSPGSNDDWKCNELVPLGTSFTVDALTFSICCASFVRSPPLPSLPPVLASAIPAQALPLSRAGPTSRPPTHPLTPCARRRTTLTASSRSASPGGGSCTSSRWPWWRARSSRCACSSRTLPRQPRAPVA